ncbi:MAG: hypothetical protein L3J83_06135 [Proteobacteria bacterium]|nr:hypothetical protein [Pseudomonadota bacterium]
MRLVIIILLALLISACQQPGEDIQDDSQILVIVGEQNISRNDLKAFMSVNGIANPTQEEMASALEDLISELSLAHFAKKQNLDLSTDQLMKIDYLKSKAYADVAIRDYIEQNPISDTEVKKEYDRVTKESRGLEFKVRHLLYKDEVEAVKMLDTINAGLDYLQAEAQYLSQRGNMKNVGDIGWLVLAQLPESFRRILPGMKTATVYQKAIVSQFGAHVLFLEDKRKMESPDLELVKAGIIQTLTNRKIDKFKQLTRAKAKVLIVEKKSPKNNPEK